jgi:hypothetical protein
MKLNYLQHLYRPLISIVVLAFLARIPFIIFSPELGGDADIYMTVADNILRGCGVSLSDINSSECIPHFGGNQLPGYPFFIALIWGLSGHSDNAVRISQMLLYILSLVWLMIAIFRLTQNKIAVAFIGALFALSPLEIAWVRYMQTETLALATTNWVIAELIFSLKDKRLRIMPLFLALTAAVFIRLDGVLLYVPVAISAFMIHTPKEALKRGMILALLLSLPIGGWTIRNLIVGLPRLYPTPFTQPNNAAPPLGYVAWGKTWITDEYQRPGWGWGVTRFVYDSIFIDDKAYDTNEEKKYVEQLIRELQGYQGKPFPAHIDTAFAEIARERTQREPFRTYVRIPLERMKSLWSNPYSSFGWPNEMPSSFSYEDHLKFVRGSIGDKLSIVSKYPFRTISKAFTGTYRFAVIISMCLVIIFLYKISNQSIKNLIWLAVSIIAARTIFMGIIGNVETRYTVEAMPGMELSIILALWAVFRSNENIHSNNE